ncbi:MAG: Acyl-CoA dehydrogenase domain protein [Myxococcaceae bacterium]|nr:Acyl-CoA dehydrogenase domain protein [Myxococcaceae bacterium]
MTILHDLKPRASANATIGRAVASAGVSSARSPSSGALLEPLELGYELRDFKRYPIATLLETGNPKVYGQCLEVITRTRAYAERHVVGRCEGWDQKIKQDHDFVPWSAIDGGLSYGLLSLSVPGVFGGGNAGPLASCVFAEELAAADAGIYVIYGAHALALSLLIGSLDTRILLRIGREMSEGEKRGKAVLLALAHTEPGGGSDVEDVDDLAHARFATKFCKVPGGYRLNARKVFISNGSIARYNVVTACEDPQRPHQTFAAFLVPSDAPGFSVGRLEHKLGQRSSTAVEILCDDVFVPGSDRIDIGGTSRLIDTALGLSRGPVGAMGTGIIRGTLERTLKYLSQKRVRGHWLYEEQWVQLILADMLGALQASRGLYMDAGLAGEAWGIGSLFKSMPAKTPSALQRNKLYETIMSQSQVTGGFQSLYETQIPSGTVQRLVSHASIAKFMCTDMSVRVAMKAMEILGEDATDPQWGIEKSMRDAKLGQIFEGTNQINRLHVARGLLTRS